MRLPLTACLLFVLPLAARAADAPVAVPAAAPAEGGYAIVVSKATQADPAWAPVVAALKARHPQAQVIAYETKLTETLPTLSAQMPRYTAFVATPKEAGRAFVAEASRLARHFNADPYTDTCWGIVTGWDGANALEMAQCPGLTMNVASGNTAFETRCVSAGVWYDELKAGLQVETKKDGSVERRQGGRDSTAGVVQGIENADLLIASSHGSERSWQLGHVYRNGFIVSKNGELVGKDSEGKILKVEGGHEKAWMPVGNCLVGHIDGPDAMALAMMKAGKVRAAAGYTVPTWYGYAGWGLLDYFVEQPGRYTYAEAVRANRLALEQRLYAAWPKAAEMNFGEDVNLGKPATPGLTEQDGAGLLYDRDVLAFYGDPAAQVVMPEKWRAYEQKLEKAANGWTLTITGNAGAESFATVNNNGSQRGGRPIVQFLPQAIDPAKVKVVEGAEWKPVFGPDWVLVPRPEHYKEGEVVRVGWVVEDGK